MFKKSISGVLITLSIICGQLFVLESKASAAVTSIALEFQSGTYGTASWVNLGDLASRSGSTASVPKSLTKSSGPSPYTMTGLDSITGQSYQYQTLQDYRTTATLRESFDVTTFQDPNITCEPGSIIYSGCGAQTSNGVTYDGHSNVFQLASDINDIGNHGNSRMSQVYGAVFGPEIWSVPFEATTGKSVSFDWAANNGSDDYEIYAFLVRISSASGSSCTTSSGPSSYGLTTPITSHSLIAYGRGTVQTWTTASGAIPQNGCYRFRFVSGSFDQTGGYALGASLYVDNTVILGQTQTVTFPQPSDLITASNDQTFNSGASSNAPGASLTFTSLTPSTCSIDSAGVITALANQVGACTIEVSASPYGDYAGSIPVSRSFALLAAPNAPSGQGTSLISGSAETCATLTANIGAWNTGGATITSTSYQWKRSDTLGGTYAEISGANGNTYTTKSEDLNKYIKVTITRTNSVGSGVETTPALLISSAGAGTCNKPKVIPASYLTFAQNGADNNSYPQSEVQGDTQPLWKNVLTRAGYTFTGWNTKADGSGTAYADQASFKFDQDYVTLYAQWKLIQTAPTLSWATPAAIQAGTALSATQLNALLSVPGLCTYSPAATTVLPVGKNTLSVTCVPTDPKYSTVSTSVVVEVLAPATVTWPAPASIQEGTPLGSAQLNATASVPGSFVYETKEGTLLTAGKSTLRTTFTPTDTRLSPVTAEVTIEVTAKPVIIPEAPASPSYSLTGDQKSTVTWGAGKNAATYTVQVDGSNACSVAALTCDIAQLLGPSNVVTVTSVASNSKTSAPVTASYIPPAAPISLAVVNFDSAKSTIKSSEETKLDAFAAHVKAAGFTTVTVQGHTDSVGGVDNQKLSLARANATITYLKKLLPNVSFAITGFADTKPVADNSTEAGKAANRRVEIFIP